MDVSLKNNFFKINNNLKFLASTLTDDEDYHSEGSG